MEQFDAYLEAIENVQIREKLIQIFEWIEKTYKDLDSVIKWTNLRTSIIVHLSLGLVLQKSTLTLRLNNLSLQSLMKR